VIILAVDPGFTGALAFYNVATKYLEIIDMPVVSVTTTTRKSRSEINVGVLAHMIRDRAPTVAVVEQVAARPGQGVVSMFRFGQTHGIILGVLGALNVPVNHVLPNTWRKALRVPQGKEGGLLRASEVFPHHSAVFSRKKDTGRADAALMAKFFEPLLDSPF
jgi:crossover junction endodeoxyribonuclease RuvC